MQETQDNQTEYLSRKDCAAKLGTMVRGKPYNERTDRLGAGRQGTAGVSRVGRDVTYFWSSVERWLRAQERTPNKAA